MTARRRSAIDDSATVVGRLVGDSRIELDRQQALQDGRKLDGRGQPGHAGQVGIDASGKAKTTVRPTPAGQRLIKDLSHRYHLTQDDVVELGVRVLERVLAANLLDPSTLTCIRYNDARPWLSVTRIDWTRFPHDFLPRPEE